jgi:alpha,alpha-trehalose-phosphate synthase [UDP-forming]/trehalose-phosphatase
MSYRELKAFIRDNPLLKNLIIVSNREPYIHKKAGRSLKVEAPAGGLTAAVDEVMRAIGGTWVAWGSGSGDKGAVDGKSCVLVPPGAPSYKLRRVWLDPELVENYYHGYSNHVLWPLCHITLDKVYFRKKYWYDYMMANEKFAKAVLEESVSGSSVWIHDYHLCMVPRMLKQSMPSLTISHFWHIPWPDHSVFRICPQSKEILEALLSNDLLGFQLPLFCRNFMDCVRETLAEAKTDFQNFIITYKGHSTKLKAFPISVDFNKFNMLARSDKTLQNMHLFKQRYHLSGKFIGVGVDRLEYTKGLIKRLQAIDLFFEKYPRYRENFTFIQIAVPTRMKEPYISYKAKVEGLVRKINRKYSTGLWSPIIYRDVKAEHEDLVVFYRLADVAIISSVYDGMNLVAKEFVASRADRKGVLLLSEFTGAAEELEGAILVNPYDIEEFSDGIKTVLELPARDKASRMKTLRRQVKEKNIYSWISEILKDMVLTTSQHLQECRYLFEHFREFPKSNIFLFLDYDGTLTPIVESPDKAVLSKKIHSQILTLKESLPVAIISGREIQDIINRVDIKTLIYAGNHGAEIWDGKKLVRGEHLSDSTKVLKKIIKELQVALSFVKGVVIEDKGVTASIHYRMVAKRDLGSTFDIFWSIAGRYEDKFMITSGKKVFEIRPHGLWNKGDAVRWIWETFGKDRVPVYIGDDTTDEDAFRAVRGKGVGICVGKSLEADYYLRNQREVRKLLNLIIGSER